MKHNLQQQIQDFFNQQFGAKPEKIVRAPGRINLIGEHTDYNNGFVFPAAIDKSMCFGISKNNTTTIRLHALNLNESIEFKIDQLNRCEYSWANYIIGNLIQLQKMGYMLEGFDCAFVSDIPIGAGLSSSSALECGFLSGLNELLSLHLSRWELIDCSQQSNHDFLGVKGGFMDQFACLFGKQNHAMLLDCQNRAFEYIPLNMDNCQWVLINSMVQHDHITSAYNDRVAACQAVVDLVQKTDKNVASLRDVNQQHLSSIKSSIDDIQFNCAAYVLEENQRAINFSKAMQLSDIHTMGGLLYESHHGLRDQYKVSCSELDVLVELARNQDGVLGSRMMGGGFGGCTLNLIEHNNIDQTLESIQHSYQKQFGIIPETYKIRIANGAGLVFIHQG